MHMSFPRQKYTHISLTNNTLNTHPFVHSWSWTHFKSVVILDDVKIHWTGKLFMNLVITGKVTISIKKIFSHTHVNIRKYDRSTTNNKKKIYI